MPPRTGSKTSSPGLIVPASVLNVLPTPQNLQDEPFKAPHPPSLCPCVKASINPANEKHPDCCLPSSKNTCSSALPRWQERHQKAKVRLICATSCKDITKLVKARDPTLSPGHLTGSLAAVTSHSEKALPPIRPVALTPQGISTKIHREVKAHGGTSQSEVPGERPCSEQFYKFTTCSGGS